MVQRVILGIIVTLACVPPLVVQTPPLGLVEGAPAGRTYRANRTVQFIDEVATQSARDEAAASVRTVTVFDPTVLAGARGDVTAFFDAVFAAREVSGQETTATIAALERQFDDYDPGWIATAAGIPDTDLRQADRSTEQLVTTVLTRRFTEEELPEVLAQMRESVENMPFTAATREMIAGLIERTMRPTLAADEAATQAARDAAAAGVDAVVIVKQAGENIVQQGEIVTSDHLEIVRRLGLLEQGGSAASFAALVALFVFMITSAGAYMFRYDRLVWDSLNRLVMLSSLLIGMVWITRGFLWFFPDLSVYVFPIPMAAMLATLLIRAREGMLVAIVTALAAVLLGFSGGAAVVAMLVWSLAAVVAMAYMTERRSLLYVGAFLVISGGAIGFVASLASGVALDEASTSLMWAASGGLISAIFGYGLLPVFEHLFGVTTDVRLLELANPTQPLLRRLMVEAPGTYSHSVMTANLAESAAEDIGANPLLARVGAYYHDVGKIKRPGFFVENQAGGHNPHDATAPTLSALIITAHVREGIELATEYRLPKEIVDIVRQHHGTSLVRYFYSKAAENGAAAEEDFRYDGERPQSREAALVMLADSSEAAVRAMKKPNPPRIETVVRQVIDEKVADGQLDSADLTLADIETIIQIYARMLSSLYHPRIEYPGTETEEVRA
jgi:hypothetical protein